MGAAVTPLHGGGVFSERCAGFRSKAGESEAGGKSFYGRGCSRLDQGRGITSFSKFRVAK